jgi:berberine-like enzyme
MHRRTLLKGMAAMIALQPDLLSRAAANAAPSGFSRVRPSDPAWPSAQSWTKLKQAVGGNLIAVEQPFGACAVDPQGANPAATKAFALSIIADAEGPRYPGLARPPIDEIAAGKDARAIDLAAADLLRIAPDAGSYVSESNYFNPRWQTAYWGENYARLRAVKAKYDPDGLFFVHNGVGSEEWSAMWLYSALKARRHE